jgi:serine/threonine protein kinase
MSATPVAPMQPPDEPIQPTPGDTITSVLTNNTYTMGPKIGEGNFGVVYGCTDTWENDLAAKVLKQPVGRTFDETMAAAEAEFRKLLLLRHPNVTYVYDAFHFRNACYIVTERCYGPVTNLFINVPDFNGQLWIRPIARCLLQAVHYLHLNNYAARVNRFETLPDGIY